MQSGKGCTWKGRKLERKGEPRAIPRHSAFLTERRSGKERWQNWEGAARVDGTSEERGDCWQGTGRRERN